MSRASNTLKASDISTTPIKLKYSSSYLSGDLPIYGIQGNNGINGSTSPTGSVLQQTINYRGIRQLYYQNYLTSSVLNSSSYYDPNQQSTACSGSAEYEDRYFPTASDAQIYTIAIPPLVFGEQISRNSLTLSPKDQSSYRVIDDGNGNLIDTINSNTHVGNVIYSQGLIIITNQQYTSSFGVSPIIIPSVPPIGAQIWSSQNLDVTTYRNGDIIPQVTDETDWINLTTGAWCYYNNNSANGEIYGKLYNWYAVNDSRGLAPFGWHIPTYNETFTLYTSLGGNPGAGGKLKEAGTSHWNSPNTGADNSTGFTSLPSGFRDRSDGSFNSLNAQAQYWTADSFNTTNAIVYILNYYDSILFSSNNNKKYGFAVRLIKD
jgi:uncharacterized protein (TIGR02145 family)